MTGHSRKHAIAAERLNRGGPPAEQRTEAQAAVLVDRQKGENSGACKDRLAAIANAEYGARRRRDRLFHANLFAEPAWDMLLDLFVQQHHGRPVSVHSLCVAAAVPQTTALRWIGKLADMGLVDRRPSPHDNRVTHIVLSEAGAQLMETYLAGQLGDSGAGSTTPLAFS